MSPRNGAGGCKTSTASFEARGSPDYGRATRPYLFLQSIESMRSVVQKCSSGSRDVYESSLEPPSYTMHALAPLRSAARHSTFHSAATRLQEQHTDLFDRGSLLHPSSCPSRITTVSLAALIIWPYVQVKQLANCSAGTEVPHISPEVLIADECDVVRCLVRSFSQLCSGR